MAGMVSQQSVVLALLARFPEGINIPFLLAHLSPPISRRTLQRRLKALEQERLVAAIGQGRATVYKLLAPAIENNHTLTYIRRLLEGREPVNYHRELLDQYEPNKTWYLDTSIRSHLHHIGQLENQQNKPAGTYAQLILNRLLIDLSWNSSRLEGNTYSYLDTERLISSGETAKGKSSQETQMILNHKAAIKFIVENIETIDFNFHTFLNLHGLLSENLMPDPDTSGKLRYRPVDIAGSVYKPTAIPALIEELFRDILTKTKLIADPYEQAFFLMVHIPYLQPFEDVNKRVSRLGANIPLLKNNLCPLTFLEVPDRVYIDAYLSIYEINRLELLRDLFVWAYERSTRHYIVARKILAEPNPIRLKYRNYIHEIVHSIVKKRSTPINAVIKNFATKNIPTTDQKEFIKIIMEDLQQLHEGTIARYELSHREFMAWKHLQKKLK